MESQSTLVCRHSRYVTATWPDSPEALDSVLASRIATDRPMVVDTHDPAAVEHVLDQLAAFLRSQPDQGYVLVLAGTASERPVSHEVSTALVENVMARVARECGPACVVLGEGASFDVPDATPHHS